MKVLPMCPVRTRLWAANVGCTPSGGPIGKSEICATPWRRLIHLTGAQSDSHRQTFLAPGGRAQLRPDPFGDPPMKPRSLHRLGVMCGLAAGAWLGAAEAPTKLVTVGFSPFIISLGMVTGVFVARWTVPVALKGTSFIMADLKEKPHLIAWGLLAGMLWAVANTLTVFAIRDVGLSIAFPLWNTNSLVGLFWG